ncbi:LEAF RUST 10 DISEASE-RESISTANCE LOCUS RECEPTOR-LIKE PROTEIN KINASE-like 2.4 [Prosopis cineraria]|uniref:LEAF RUST 10 DISEASE-RESISTANCE LOCUS RECEPTOR-LIKE PROTEIN KINASE-like 2.4 n=1 Tax=Prosopis cineraria TaxID=364024 RepID=UPI00241092A7|nr:LEAF RUST 10 DISEASE-RESISTANCE LOCUS RECEPTOR-LIKE PROTEIN KINASE-like 2.4 [Prosopis cineraria]
MAVTRYKFTDIMKITNSFEAKLGQGGYCVVCKENCSMVDLLAVKILKTPKGNEEEFINEAASIGRTSHINVVTLLGFCLEGRKKVLVYEFMSNGSLDKFIHKENETILPSNCNRAAQGLKYLHEGCSTQIVHLI